MASLNTITLSGETLGQRHRSFNENVREAKQKGLYIPDLEFLRSSSKSPVDRLFDIDLANSYKMVDYIILNLKDYDLLYVNRALKSTWLLQHPDIINPKYLEEVLFPEMVAQAVTKMKHWLYINLREPSMCQEFYLFYKEKKFEFAVKFLNHCNEEFIVSEVPKILIKLLPHYVKILCEKCPKFAKIYFDSLALDEKLTAHYVEQEQSYYNSVKCVLKMDGEVFLDITEKYFNMNRFSRLSASQTDYIMTNHKDRFMSKLELYIAYLLHIPTVAHRLSVEECQEAVVKLAKATYLQHWFEYKVVEPLVKRLRPDLRAAFKKRIFVQKDIGNCVNKWLYDTPASPAVDSDPGPHVFDDEDFKPIYNNVVKRCIKKKKGGRFDSYFIESCNINTKTELDRLFDEFRFIGFDRALHDLGQRLKIAGSAERRRDMFLVLVSKSGGRSDAVAALLRLAARHTNELVHIRAAVIRSLVKRANVWRLPADIWQHFLDFSHGLGLDGSAPEAACLEGLHAVVIRQLLTGECDLAIIKAFMNDFSTLAEYSLSPDERMQVANGLQNKLITLAENAEPKVAADYLNKLFEVLKTYDIKIESSSPTVCAVTALATRDADVACSLLERLYIEKIARRKLFRMNLKFRRDEAMFLNALRHDPQALDLDQVVEALASSKTWSFDHFISKLVIYFTHKEDFVKKLLCVLMEKINREFNVKLVRPLAVLLGQDLNEVLQKVDQLRKERAQLAAGLRACMHLNRYSNNLLKMDWRKAGVKAIATRVMCCREIDRTCMIRELATDRRTIRVALSLSLRTQSELVLETFRSAATTRRSVALRAALMYFHRYGNEADIRVWDIIKPLISTIDLTNRDNLRWQLEKIDWIPFTIKADYCATLYPAVEKISNASARDLLTEWSKLIYKSKNALVETVLLLMLEKAVSFPAPFIRYLMLSKTEDDLQFRFEKIGDKFFALLDSQRCSEVSLFTRQLKQIIKSLKYNVAFLDPEVLACFSVMERILVWMQKFMSKEKFFDKYVLMHLNMLYFKAVRQCIKQMPEVFADEKRKKSEGAEAVGFIFGKYIAREVAELVRTYFDSVIELYSDVLDDYLNNYFMHGSSKATFTCAVIKGILSESVGCQRRIAVSVFRECRRFIKGNVRKEIEEIIFNDKGLELFVHAKLF